MIIARTLAYSTQRWIRLKMKKVIAKVRIHIYKVIYREWLILLQGNM